MSTMAVAPEVVVAGPSTSRALSLDDLLALDAVALGSLYRNARTPRLEDISGDLRGRMLAVPALPWPLARVSRWFASWNRFPWRGKSFTPLSPDRGEGANRVILDRWRWYGFTTSVGRSRAGDFDAVQLDYARKENPFFIRAVKDEIRELSSGLYLGQAWVRLGGKPRLALYFGLEKKPVR